MFHQMYVAKGNRGRKIPQLSHLRQKMYDDRIPPVKMDVGFQEKGSGDITVLKGVSHIPVSRFPTNQYRRLYEIGYVDVSNFIFSALRTCKF